MEEQHYQLLDGKAVSAQMKKEMAEEVAQIKAAGGKIPHLAAILVGHDGGSETYVASKVKTCQEIGFKSTLIRFEEDVTEEELLRKVDELNNDPDVDGFIVQLPLPKHISEQKVIEAIDYRKDVDGFHPINVGRMSIGLPCNFTKERCGWFSSAECRCNDYRRTGLFILYTGRNYSAFKAFRNFNRREKLCGCGTQQYCRQADGYLDDAEILSGRLYGDRMP